MASVRRLYLLILFSTLFSPLLCDYQDFGSCNFEASNSLCGYTQPNNNNFNWTHLNINGSNVMLTDAASHPIGSTAKLITPKIKLQETHCVKFDLFKFEETAKLTVNESSPTTSVELNIYLQDNQNQVKNRRQSIWNSSGLKTNKWETVQLALTPRAYKIVFEAVVRDAGSRPVAIDNVLVSPSACVSVPHFLRLGAKVVNTGQNESLQCLLFGHSGPNTHVILQKSTGETLHPHSKVEVSDHLSVTFSFWDVALSANGSYRCVSHNATQVGVSNYAPLLVKVPPSPKRGPQVVKPGATNFVIQLNADDYTGDGPVIRKILIYRPVNGDWSDIHHIETSEYKLWHLQPDTEYDLAVTLVRSGPGGAGPPGPTLRKRTKCGSPKDSVQNINFHPKNSSIFVQWDTPDFSITQCHNYAFVVKYRLYSEPTVDAPGQEYRSERVEKNNSFMIVGLSPYTKYSIKVELTNSAGEGSKETGEYTVQTLEGVPGPLPRDSFAVVGFNDTTISVRWGEPQQPNGVVEKYEISYRGSKTFDPTFNATSDKGLFEVKGSEQHLVVGPLHPGTTYQISIRAKTSAGAGSAIELPASTDIAPPTLPQYPPPSRDPGEANITVTPTTIEINIIPAQSFGAPITGYYVIVVDDTPKPPSDRTATLKSKRKSDSRKGRGRRKKKTRNKRSVNFLSLSRWKRQDVEDVSDDNDVSNDDMSGCYATPTTYDEAAKNNQSHYASGKLLPDQVKQEMKFVVGDGPPQNGFNNPPLDPNKDYKIYVRVESEAEGKITVNCVLVAFKAHVPPTTTPLVSSTTPPSNIGGGNGNTGDVNDPTTKAVDPGSVEPSEQDRTMMYAGIGGAVAGILIIIILIILVVMRRKRQKHVRKDEVVNPFEVRMMLSDISSPTHTLLPVGHQGNDNSDRQALMPDVVGYEHQDFLDKSSEGGAAAGGYGSASNNERFAVRVDDFHVHVSQMKASGGYGFRDEFSSFPDGPTAPWAVAASTLNKGRNRYGNIMAYDHSRVVLDPPDGYEEEFESDYINASYVNGYKSPSMYIATQAPSEETTSDFWWMVWQEKSTMIVMLTNLVELGKRKCHKYWPDDRGLYGTVEVSLNSEENLADYAVRTFILQQVDGYDVREIKLFHFTAWPDHGVPSRPTNLLSFIRKIKANEPQGQGPTIVHCSAGSGRTGCFMVVDMMLDMARDEEIVDIHNTVRDLRSRRVNMVQTEEQYVFIHEAVLEALLCGETMVVAEKLIQHYDDLITVDPQTHFAPIQEEFETLNVITPKLTEDECSVARLPRNRGSNRFMDVLPADRHLAYLYTPNAQDRDNNYINAVYLDSYSRKNSFLVTQTPLPSTVVDIWRLIYDHNCTSIVTMDDISEHDQTCSQYWPDVGSAIFGPFTVELLTKDDEVEVVSRLFKLQNVTKPGEPYRLVQQFQLTNWPAAQPVPYSRNSVLRIIHLVNAWQTECTRNGDTGKTLVHCVAGAGRSGTFVSCFNMCGQLQRELAVDVFNIVQRQRNVRPQLVETLEQYRFCYEVGIEFAQR